MKKLRIAFCGSHGTGKTTLLNSIDHTYLKTLPIITEISRSVIKEIGVSPKDMTPEERIGFQKLLYRKQFDKELELKDGFISDRSMIDVACYTHSIPIDSEEKKRLVSLCLSSLRERYDLIFYLPIEFPLEKDGTRFEGDEYQKEIDEKIKRALLGKRIPFVTLTGSVEQRLEKLYKTIELFTDETTKL